MEKTARFQQFFSMLAIDKGQLLDQLKYKLGHPQYANDLKNLDNSAHSVAEKISGAVVDLFNGITTRLSTITVEHLNDLEFLVIIFAGLLGEIVMVEDIDLPGIVHLCHN